MKNMEKSVIYKNGAFYASFNLPSEMKRQGWKHNNRDGWFTTNLMSASLLRDHADERAKNIINKAFIQMSHWKGTLSIPEGLETFQHQPVGAYYCLNRSRSCLALSPGLGKTIIAAIVAATIGKRCIYVCPPFLQLNTLEEFQKWAPNLNTKILDNVDWVIPDVLIVPDSQISNQYLRDYIKHFAPELFIGDEWHRFKTDTAQRTKAVYGHRDNRKKIAYTPGILDFKSIKKVIVMSGTIMPNRPMELYPMLKKLAGEFIEFMNMHQFGVRYCAAFPIQNDYNGKTYGYDYTGCDEKNFEKLMATVKTPIDVTPYGYVTVGDGGFMLRLDKTILGMPLLTEEILFLGEDMPRELKAMNAEMLKMYSPKDLIKMKIKQMMGKAKSEEDVHIMTYRRLLGQYKVKPSCQYIQSELEDTEDVWLVSAIHKDVVRDVEERLSAYNPMVITGDVPTRKRQLMVKEFQKSKTRRLMLGNLDAMGVGFTITRANRVGLLEFEYDPGSNRQLIDRAHRIGIEHEVWAQYFVFRNSLDGNTMRTLLNKEKLIAYV